MESPSLPVALPMPACWEACMPLAFLDDVALGHLQSDEHAFNVEGPGLAYFELHARHAYQHGLHMGLPG